MELSVVRVSSPGVRWAVKAVSKSGEVRYRGFYYNQDAKADKDTWDAFGVDQRNFNHNFFSAETLRIIGK